MAIALADGLLARLFGRTAAQMSSVSRPDRGAARSRSGENAGAGYRRPIPGTLEYLVDFDGERTVYPSPIVALTCSMLEYAIECNARSVELTTTDEGLNVTLELEDGRCELQTIDPRVGEAVLRRFRTLACCERWRSGSPSSGRIRGLVAGQRYDFEVVSEPGHSGEVMHIRIVPVQPDWSLEYT